MVSHAPKRYICPFCALVERRRVRGLITLDEEVISRDEKTITFVASHGFGSRPGHLLVIPRGHFENIYELPDEVAAAVAISVRRAAIALKAALNCGGISTRQHNEPAGDQDVWHYHVHVFPRYLGDDLYRSSRRPLPAGEGIMLAERVRRYL